MKKFIHTFLLIFMLLALPQTVMAANGDIVGNIYSTDIKANINGVWVDSYSIDGKTVVVIEDITENYRYYDGVRTLICSGFDRDYLKEGKNKEKQTHGKVIGYIYETDIKTYINGKSVTCYALNGKMAVALEDLGNDSEFSDIGGRYFWNADDRTITLELAYHNGSDVCDILHEKHLNMMINFDTGVVEFVPAAINHGSISGTGNQPAEIKYNNEIILRKFDTGHITVVDNNGSYELVNDGIIPTRYYDVEKIRELTKDIEPAQPTYQDWLAYFEQNTLSTVKDTFETDDYIFLYMTFSHTHGGTESLIKLDKHDGTRINFDENFESVSAWGQKYFENVVIDRENEKVYLHYDVDYVIDLKTDILETITN